ncbi:MAG: histidine phosphatase family protein [Caulobacteraceae bacterium]
MRDRPSVDQNLRLHLIRHGETAWSLTGKHTGRTDLALTTQGEGRARLLKPLLDAIRFEAVFTSPALRARRTRELAGPALPAAVVEPDLAEWDYGNYEGKTSREIWKDRPGWDCYRDGCPGGESPGDVSNRADRLIARLCRLSGNIALFSHGEFGCALAARWIGSPVAQGEHLVLETASLSILGLNPAHPGLRVIVVWNSFAPVADTSLIRPVQEAFP